MKCPHCKNDLKVPYAATANADMYGKSVLTVTECCGMAVYVKPIRSYEVTPYMGKRTEDDWGNEIKAPAAVGGQKMNHPKGRGITTPATILQHNKN